MNAFPRAPGLASDPMACLRAATRAEHERAEKTSGFMRPDVTPEIYARWLRRLLRFHGAFEARLREQAPVINGIDLNERSKAPWLREDLAILGAAEFDRGAGPDPEPDLGPDLEPAIGPRFGAEAFTELPSIATRAEAVGAMYVLEGSTLGGQVIVQSLRARLPNVQPEAFRFFSGYGERTREMWAQFSAAAREALRSADDVEAAVVSARKTFAAFAALMRDQATNE